MTPFSSTPSLALFLLIVQCIFARHPQAQQDDQNHFINPPSPGVLLKFDNDNVYAVGSTVVVKWVTNYTQISLTWHQQGNSQAVTLIDNKPVVERYAWDVNLTDSFDLANGNSEHQLFSHSCAVSLV
jgi:hypothetical protein